MHQHSHGSWRLDFLFIGEGVCCTSGSALFPNEEWPPGSL